MKGFQAALGVALTAVYHGFRAWQNPGLVKGPLTEDEIARYSDEISKNLHLSSDEELQFLSRLRAWMQVDDGKPVYMLNLMRYYPALKPIAGTSDAATFNGTPEESNAYYEAHTAPLLAKIGGFPIFSGKVTNQNLVGYDPELDNWNRIVVVRYPSRRSFLNLLSDPEYGPLEPYKIRALELLLVPSSRGIVLPDATWIVGAACVFIFLAAGWVRASRRK